ncbi:MAG: carbon-nitrogen hydrolase family protein [Dehalococcoidia bacterium]|nr:carbon-nitrogen hydrolase family protein [Dehalococcoidia bacterium]
MPVEYKDLRFKVAAAQAASVYLDAPKYFDVGATLDKAVGLIEEAGRMGARLIVFPECFLPCYPHWSLDLADRPAFDDMWAKYLWNSVEVPGPETGVLCEVAKRSNIHIVMGITERDKKYQGRMYNSILYISAEGNILGTHRKIVNTVQERFFHTPGGGGENLKAVFDTDIGKLGGSICGEHCQLLLTHLWITQGVQIHCSLWPGQPALETHTDVHTRALCYTAHCFGVLSASYIPKKDWPKNFYRNSRFTVPQGFRGGSGIVSPRGEYIAGPVYDKETIVCAEIDLSELDRSRSGINMTGIYNRWDLLNVNVREEAYEPAVPMQNGEQPDNVKELEVRIKRLEEQVEKLSKDIKQPKG